MGRLLLAGGLAFLALGLVAPAARADEDVEGLKREVDKLRQEVQVMRTSMLQEEIDSYLSDNESWQGAQGGGALQGITIHARFTSVLQGTLGSDPEDVLTADGDVDLDFHFQVTDNLSIFLNMTANNGGSGSFPTAYGFQGVATGATFAGATDGIGVNGTVPTNPGAVAVNEAGIQSSLMLGDTKIHWELGEIDPRYRFNQNRFADDENTQFIHNSFDDTAAHQWLTGSSGATSIGWHFWINFGDNDQFTLNFGWFNAPGAFFDNGQFMIQFSWKGEISGREMNLRVFAFIDEINTDASGDGDVGGGVSWDWMATETIGVFFRIAANGEDINPVELDASLGAAFHGLLESRPDDVLGVAIGFISANDTVVTVSEDTEVTLEIYWKFVGREDGKLQITPHLIYVADPGGGTPGTFADDQLFILGLRVHVPF